MHLTLQKLVSGGYLAPASEADTAGAPPVDRGDEVVSPLDVAGKEGKKEVEETKRRMMKKTRKKTKRKKIRKRKSAFLKRGLMRLFRKRGSERKLCSKKLNVSRAHRKPQKLLRLFGRCARRSTSFRISMKT